MKTKPRMPCANCNHTADEHMQMHPMKCLFGSTTYEPIEPLAFHAWYCAKYPAHAYARRLQTFFVDAGKMYSVESVLDNVRRIDFQFVGPVNPSFYKRTG